MQAKDEILAMVARLGLRPPFLLAIDGRSAAGKTTLAGDLEKLWGCKVVHMDDFYLPFAKRTRERMAQPGGHMDLDRLREEVLLPLRAGRSATYRPYDCHGDRRLPPRELDGGKPTVVEGAYSCHPALSGLYHARVFLDIAPELQLARLRNRDPAAVDSFLTLWIPREETYFRTCEVRERCDLCVWTVEERGDDMLITKAKPEQFQAVRSFYHSLIDGIAGLPYGAGWIKDVYPAPEYLRDSIRDGSLFLATEGAAILGAMVLNHQSNDGYKQFQWPTEAEEHEVTVIHALGVHPSYGGKGYGKQMVQFAIDHARRHRQKVIRLDVLKGNLPAERLYAGMGFQYLHTLPMFYEDTGWTDYELFEYRL